MTLNFNFNNTYTNLPEYMTTKLSPTPVKNPEMIILNYDLAENLGLKEVGIKTGGRGEIIVNKHNQTNIKSIFAISFKTDFQSL